MSFASTAPTEPAYAPLLHEPPCLAETPEENQPLTGSEENQPLTASTLPALDAVPDTTSDLRSHGNEGNGNESPLGTGTSLGTLLLTGNQEGKHNKQPDKHGKDKHGGRQPPTNVTKIKLKHAFDPSLQGKLTKPTVSEVIVTEDPQCLELSSLDALAQVTYKEAASLVKANQIGLRRFFEAKGCSSLGEKLAVQGVSGTNVSLLTPANIEADLGLTLGEQLALKNFVKRLKVVAKTSMHHDVIWQGNEFLPHTEHEEVKGCGGHVSCPDFKWCKDEEEEEVFVLPPAHYSLTDAALTVVTSEWADGDSPTGNRKREKTEKCGCGWLCGFEDEPEPPYKTRRDNITLTCVEDVDNYVNKKAPHERKWSFMDFLCGYWAHHKKEPAHIEITYVDRGNDSLRRKVVFRVDPKEVQDITQRILDARQAAFDSSQHDESVMGHAAGSSAASSMSPGTAASLASLGTPGDR